MSKTFIFTNCKGRTLRIAGNKTIDDLVRLGFEDLHLISRDTPPSKDPADYRCDPRKDYKTTKQEKSK